MAPVTDAKRRLVEWLKRADTATVPDLAAAFGLTDTAVRQHLEALESVGLVERAPSASRARGRPPVRWRLTEQADELFPDRHRELTVELLEHVRQALGDDALQAVVDARTARQETTYRAALPDPAAASVPVRVRRLAAIRAADGYLAEAQADGEAMVLTEHHCPICDAAATCQGLCRAELELFQRVLGDDVVVTRTSHLLAGDARCAYRIAPVG